MRGAIVFGNNTNNRICHPITFILAFRASRLAGLAVGLGLSALTAYQRSQAAQMASEGSHGGHLDANAGREVVYCHACSNEWHRDDHGLICSRCESDITEIISPENDPRDIAPSSNSTSPGLPPSRYADDSDPDEADIEEHVGPQGFHFRRSTRSGSEQRHHDPSMDPVFERFYDMIQNFGHSGPPGQPRRTGGSGLSGRGNDDTFAGPRMQRTTFTSGTFGGGTASVTIFSSPALGPQRGNEGENREGGGDHHNHGGADPFQAIFSNLMGELSPPAAAGEHGRQAGPQFGLARGLQEILNLFNPANAMMGDAVYSQEALDRIITQLMEVNPQSNAAPPASEEALHKLDRRTVDTQMLEPEETAECSICIDEMKVGETAVFLPCKHWFHEDCVVLWLKEHNTCPVCRTPMEKNNAAANRSARGGSSSGGGAARSGNPTRPPNSPPNFSRDNSDQSRAFSGRYDGGADTPTGRAAADMVSAIYVDAQDRPTNQRLDEALRSVENMQRERDHDRQGRATASGFSYDTSRLQRRTSHSPTSPRNANFAEQGARMRQRSPSESNRRGTADQDGHRQSGPGAWGWIRDRFAGNGGSGDIQDSQGQGQS